MGINNRFPFQVHKMYFKYIYLHTHAQVHTHADTVVCFRLSYLVPISIVYCCCDHLLLMLQAIPQNIFKVTSFIFLQLITGCGTGIQDQTFPECQLPPILVQHGYKKWSQYQQLILSFQFLDFVISFLFERIEFILSLYKFLSFSWLCYVNTVFHQPFHPAFHKHILSRYITNQQDKTHFRQLSILSILADQMYSLCLYKVHFYKLYLIYIPLMILTLFTFIQPLKQYYILNIFHYTIIFPKDIISLNHTCHAK